MAQWKKIVVSGSNAKLNTLDVKAITADAINVKAITASNNVALQLPNVTLKGNEFNPLIVDSSGKVHRGAQYAPAVGGEGSSTVGVQGVLPNNIAIIGSGSGFIQTASSAQNVDFNNADLFNINSASFANISASGNISTSGHLFIHTTTEPQKPNYQVLITDPNTGRVYRTGSYTEGVTSYTALDDIPEGIISSSAQIAQDISGSWQKNQGILSGSAQIADDISGSLGPNADLIRSLTAIGISGSWQGFISGSGIISSSLQFTSQSDVEFRNITASIISASSITSSNIFTENISASGDISASSLFVKGDAHILGGLDLDGTFDYGGFTFTEDNVTIITGSNNFGSTASVNTHKFTGSVFISSSQTNAFVIVSGSNTQTFEIKPSGNVGLKKTIFHIGSNSKIQFPENNTINFETSNAERLRILPDGNIGIGSATPPEKLTVKGNISASGNITTTGNISASFVSVSKDLHVGGAIYGTIQTANQPNITSIGSLTGLTTTGNISASFISASNGLYSHGGIFGASITSSGNISASGDIKANRILLPSSTNDNPPVYTFEGDEDTGMYHTESNGIGFRGAGNDLLTLRSTKGAEFFTNITASSNISASGYISASKFIGTFVGLNIENLSNLSGLKVSGSWGGYITGSGIVSSSNNLIAHSGSLQLLGTDGDLITTGSITTLGNITSSGNISSSGLLFASLSLQPNSPELRTVLYDSSSGRFYYTGSITGGGGVGVGFPFEGHAAITGSLHVSGVLGDITKIHTPVEIKSNVVIDGNLTVNGETTTINVTELAVEDRFIIIGSGSSNLADTDVGIIFDVDTVDGTGSAFFFDESEDRFAVGKNIQNNIGADNSVGGGGIGAGSHAGFVVTTTIADNSTNPNFIADSARFGLGELRILTNGDVYIYTNDS